MLSLSWDKAAVKTALVDIALPTPYGRVVDTDAVEDWDRFPAIVKPAFEDCGLGIDTNAVVLDAKELGDRVAHICETFAQPALVEEFIDGREFHVTLWGNVRMHMLPAAEMDFSAFTDVRDRLCTFDSKFTPGSRHYEGVKLRIPATLDTGEHSALQRTSEAAYRQLGCRDFARLELRLRDDKFYVLDVNPNADISPDTKPGLCHRSRRHGLRRLPQPALKPGCRTPPHSIVDREASMLRLYEQGGLDGLCAIYCIVNAARIISSIRDTEAKKLFRRILEHLEQTRDLSRVLSEGIGLVTIGGIFRHVVGDLIPYRSMPYKNLPNTPPR